MHSANFNTLLDCLLCFLHLLAAPRPKNGLYLKTVQLEVKRNSVRYEVHPVAAVMYYL